MGKISNDNVNGQPITNINTHRHSALSGKNGFNPVYKGNTNSNGMLQTSTNIFIYANGGIVGMIQSFRVSENRGVNKLNAIGYEGVVQAVPQNTQGGQLDVSRMALYGGNLMRALGMTMNGDSTSTLGGRVHTTGFTDMNVQGVPGTPSAAFRTLRDQRVPLEIKTRTPINTQGLPGGYYEETYVDCWLASYSKSYAVGEVTVTENATIQYGDVY